MTDRGRRIASVVFDLVYYPAEAGLACAVYAAVRVLVRWQGGHLPLHSAWVFALLWLLGHVSLNVALTRRDRRKAQEKVAYWCRSRVKSPYLPRQ